MTQLSSILSSPAKQLPTVQVVSTQELRNILFARRGSCFLSFVARYDMADKGKMLVGGRNGVPVNPYFIRQLFKISTSLGSVNFDYEAGVERRLDNEGKDISDFQRGESWHRPIMDNNRWTPLCVHAKDIDCLTDDTKTYLRYRQDSVSSIYVDGHGDTVEKESIAQWLPKKSHYENQGLDNPLAFQVIALTNLISITLDNVKYQLR